MNVKRKYIKRVTPQTAANIIDSFSSSDAFQSSWKDLGAN